MDNSTNLKVMFIIVLLILIPLSVWTDRSLDFWYSYFKEVEMNFPYWISFIFTVILNAASFLFNIVTEILRIFLTK